METIKIWEGRKGAHFSDYTLVEFQGEKLGSWKTEERNHRWYEYTVYRTADGTIIIHRVKWTRWSDESDFARIYKYESMEEAEKEFPITIKKLRQNN